jgi:hypothetical protein
MGELLQSIFQIVCCILAGFYFSWKLALVCLGCNFFIALAGKYLVTVVTEAQVCYKRYGDCSVFNKSLTYEECIG